MMRMAAKGAVPAARGGARLARMFRGRAQVAFSAGGSSDTCDRDEPVFSSTGEPSGAHPAAVEMHSLH